MTIEHDMEKATQDALKESEDILIPAEGRVESRPGSVDAEFTEAKAEAMKKAEDPRQPPEEPVAEPATPPHIAANLYPVVTALSLPDLRERLALCAQHGVELYEDGPVKIKFSPEAHKPKEERTPHVTETW